MKDTIQLKEYVAIFIGLVILDLFLLQTDFIYKIAEFILTPVIGGI